MKHCWAIEQIYNIIRFNEFKNEKFDWEMNAKHATKGFYEFHERILLLLLLLVRSVNIMQHVFPFSRNVLLKIPKKKFP